MAGTDRVRVGRGLASFDVSLAAVLEEAFVVHGVEIRRFLLRWLRDADAADDLTQDVFVEAGEWLARRGPPDSMARLLQSIASRRVVDAGRSHLELVGLSEVGEREDAFALQPALAGAVAEALRRLPSSERRVVVMRVVQGCEFSEIADATHMSEVACRRRFARGQRALRMLLPTCLAALGADHRFLV